MHNLIWTYRYSIWILQSNQKSNLKNVSYLSRIKNISQIQRVITPNHLARSVELFSDKPLLRLYHQPVSLAGAQTGTTQIYAPIYEIYILNSF